MVIRVILLLVMALGIFVGGNLLFADETGLPMAGRTIVLRDGQTESEEAVHPKGTASTDTTSGTVLCPGCAIPAVVITHRTFTAGTDCVCIGTESITIGEEVVIQKGARVIFEAPKVYFKSSFHAEQGSVVKIQWDDPPPPPG